MIHNSPLDQTMKAKFDLHIAECAECREDLILFHKLQNATRNKSIETNWYKLSNSQLVSNVRNRIQYRQFLPSLLRPLPGLVWIIVTFLMVALLSWGIVRLRAEYNIEPANSAQPFPTRLTPTESYQGSKDCRNIIYTVDEGNTLLAISAYFNVAVDAIWRENNLGNDPVLKPGMSLSIPFCGWTPVLYTYNLDGVTPINNCPLVRYTIQQDDTLEAISIAFNVPVETIVSENQLGDNSILSPGKSLVITLCKTP
jgi:LysM repeat protein